MKIHMVKKGDTLYELSKKYHVDLDKLIAANPQLTNPDMLEVGAKIKIPSGSVPVTPPPGTIEHKVVQGDTLWKLSKKYGVSLQAMINANKQLTNPNILMTGMSVFIPIHGPTVTSEAGAGNVILPSGKKNNAPMESPIQKQNNAPVPELMPLEENKEEAAPIQEEKEAPEVKPLEKENPIVAPLAKEKEAPLEEKEINVPNVNPAAKAEPVPLALPWRPRSRRRRKNRRRREDGPTREPSPHLMLHRPNPSRLMPGRRSILSSSTTSRQRK
ncbi:LysM peptidoglycan-binding domain-containing protein [Paenibacillus sp. CC-CFT747]|nr:LysM peptidoglycan-binding domain-containing protein [Paenibacillus sp. CC-CFT747]